MMPPPGVLIVDDDADIRELLAVLLQEERYSVFTAPDGLPALALLRSYPSGLVVLLDLWMPRLDGFALLQAIANDPPRSSLHAFILMSACASLPPPLLPLLSLLHVALLPKPFDLDAALAAVARAASQLSPP